MTEYTNSACLLALRHKTFMKNVNSAHVSVTFCELVKKQELKQAFAVWWKFSLVLAVSATCAAERTPCSSARAIHIHRPNAIHSRTARGSAFIANASGPKTKSSGAQWMKLPSGGQSASTAEHRRRSLLSAADSRRRRAQAHLFRPPCHALAALSGGAARHASRPSRRCHQTAPRPGRSHRRCAPLAVQAASAASAT